jgi:hypothetical protein
VDGVDKLSREELTMNGEGGVTGMSRTARRIQALVAVSALAATALIVGAWTLGGTETAAGTSSPPTWTPGGQLPGVPVGLSRPAGRVQTALQNATALSTGIDSSSLREVVVGGGFGSRMRLITARGPGGAACFSFVTDSGVARQFSCLTSPSGGGALVRFVGDGGATLGKVEWTSMVGFARSDVARVTLVRRDGSEQELALNASRGFSYSTDTDAAFPKSLRAYDAAGSLIENLPTYP